MSTRNGGVYGVPVKGLGWRGLRVQGPSTSRCGFWVHVGALVLFVKCITQFTAYSPLRRTHLRWRYIGTSLVLERVIAHFGPGMIRQC